MELSALEKSFFQNFLPVELDVPVHAELTYMDESLEMIVVPRIDQHGYFVMDYSNASPFVPESDRGVFRLDLRYAFGLHPLLERAWLSEEPVTIELRISHQCPLPPPFQERVQVKAKVISANQGHRGRIALWENQIARDVQSIQKTRFNLVGFSRFPETPRFQEYAEVSRVLKPVIGELPDGWRINGIPPSTRLFLNSGDGWNVEIVEKPDQLRRMVNHEGVATRTDGRDYELRELENLLDGLRTFFAFVVGDFCHPTVAVGYSKTQRPSWGQIGRLPEESSPRMNWFKNDYMKLTGHFLEVLFPKFWQSWSNRPKQVETVVDLHIRSLSTRQNGNPLAALVESFASLEGLASLTVGKTISNDAAAIDEVLKCLRVPNRTLPSINNRQITAMANRIGIKKEEGIHLLNKVRNFFPHPLLRHTTAEIKIDLNELVQEDPLSIVYLHDLCQFYFEHLFLAYCGPEFHPKEVGKERYRRWLVETNAVRG